MRTVLKILIPIILSFKCIGVFSQVDSTISTNKNAISIELFGKGRTYSINYHRFIKTGGRTYLNTSIGFNYGYGILATKCHPLSFPASINWHYKIFHGKIQFNVGIGSSLLYNWNGTNLSREEVLLNENGEFLPRGSCNYNSKYGFDFFGNLGAMYYLNKTWALKSDFYWLSAYDSWGLDERYWTPYLGLGVQKTF